MADAEVEAKQDVRASGQFGWRRKKFLGVIIAGSGTVADATAAVGITDATLADWSKDIGFRNDLDEAIANRAQLEKAISITRLAQIRDDPASSDDLRMRAIEGIATITRPEPKPEAPRGTQPQVASQASVLATSPAPAPAKPAAPVTTQPIKVGEPPSGRSVNPFLRL